LICDLLHRKLRPSFRNDSRLLHATALALDVILLHVPHRVYRSGFVLWNASHGATPFSKPSELAASALALLGAAPHAFNGHLAGEDVLPADDGRLAHQFLQVGSAADAKKGDRVAIAVFIRIAVVLCRPLFVVSHTQPGTGRTP
jgi:hypothetical protein